MANSLSNILPKILARGLLALREQAVMPRLVNGDYSREAAERGDTIDVPLSSSIAVSDVAPAATPPAAADVTPTKVQIALDQWKQNDAFYLTDKELVEVDRNAHFVPMQVAEAIKALANTVNSYIHATYTGIYGYVGDAGTTPFTTGSAAGVKGATQARKVLNQQVAPRTDRRGVLDYDAEAAALELAAFHDAEKVGSTTVKMEGEIGRKFGIDWVADDAVVTHTAGTGASVQTAATGAVGDATIAIDTGSGTLVVGDIVTFGGHSQTYVVTTAVADVSSATMAFDPPLVATVADNEAITVKASHVVNLAFHRDAIAFATRPLIANTVDLAMGSEIVSMQDPVTGLVLRLEVSRQHKRTAWEFDLLYGAKLVRPELACRIAG